jgi:hypothetical protein
MEMRTMSIRLAEASAPAAVSEPRLPPEPAAVIETRRAVPESTTLCPLLGRPCKEIPKQPGFKTCFDCTVYKVLQMAD